MSLSQLLNQLNSAPTEVQFLEVIAVIDANYQFTPTRFVNGKTINEANQNNGSCKIFSFAYLHQLTVAQTLACFGDFYRKDVLAYPQHDDHQNIRNFIQFGWQGVQFDGQALTSKL